MEQLMKRMGLEKVETSDCMYPTPTSVCRPLSCRLTCGEEGYSLCLPSSNTLFLPNTDVQCEPHQARHWEQNEWDPISALQTVGKCKHWSFKDWNRCLCEWWAWGSRICLVRIQGRREVSSLPRESAKASQKWLNWVFKDWRCFPRRNGVWFMRRSFQADGTLSVKNPGDFLLSAGPGQVLWGWSWLVILLFFLALLSRIIEKPPTKHSAVPSLLWGPAGVGRGGSTLTLYGSEADFRSWSKVMGRQVQTP